MFYQIEQGIETDRDNRNNSFSNRIKVTFIYKQTQPTTNKTKIALLIQYTFTLIQNLPKTDTTEY